MLFVKSNFFFHQQRNIYPPILPNLLLNISQTIKRNRILARREHVAPGYPPPQFLLHAEAAISGVSAKAKNPRKTPPSIIVSALLSPEAGAPLTTVPMLSRHNCNLGAHSVTSFSRSL